jgi:hypothetical protein
MDENKVLVCYPNRYQILVGLSSSTQNTLIILLYSVTKEQSIKFRGWCDLMEHDNPAMRAPVLQAIEELARTSRTRTELRDEYEVY